MRRGELYVAAARGAYTGKPRPVVIVQDDRFDASASVTVCPVSTHLIDAPLFRIDLVPAAGVGVDRPSQIMVDKVTTIPRQSVTEYVGRLSDADLVKVDRALLVFLGLAG